MSMFSRQPELPPERPAPPSAAARPVPPGVATPQPLAHFAVVGVDTQTGQPISTVIEARSENEAQQLAQQKGIIVDEFKPMHPLAGAAAAKLARDDPRDRFNPPSHLAPDPQGRAAPGPGYVNPDTHSTVGSHAADDPDYLSPRIPLGLASAEPGPVRQPKGSGPFGGLAVLAVLGLIAAIAYVSVLSDGGLGSALASFIPAPEPVEAAFDVTEPLGIDLSNIDGYEEWTPDRTITDMPGPANGKLFLQATVPPIASGPDNVYRGGSAVIAGRIVTPGQSIAGYRLVRVYDRYVLLQKDRKLVALRMPTDTE